MRKIFLILLSFQLSGCLLYAQNDNPYKMFGHISNVEYKVPVTDLLYIRNSDTSSSIKALALSVENHSAYLLDANNNIVDTISVDPQKLLIWLSVDPKSDKYPSHSPYVYCANNPVKLIDPDGRSYTDFKDGNGKLIKHIDDGSNAVFSLQNGGNGNIKSTGGKAYFAFNGYSNQNGTNSVNINSVIDYSQQYSRDNYKNDGKTTYCNYAAQFVVNSFASAAQAAGYDVDGDQYVKGGANTIRANFPAGLTLGSHSQAVSKSQETVNDQAVNIVIGSMNGHVLTFTRDGRYSNVGGTNRNGNGGSSIQTPWLMENPSAKYFEVRAIKAAPKNLLPVEIIN